MTWAELMQQAAAGVMGQADLPQFAVGTMLSPFEVKLGDTLTYIDLTFTQTARERELKSGDRVACLYNSGSCIVIDRVVE